MPLSRFGKLCQSLRAQPAVNSIQGNNAEPKRPASFTYLQVQAQVVHRSLSRRVSPPGEPPAFLHPCVLTRLLGSAIHHLQGSPAPSARLRHPSQVAQHRRSFPWEINSFCSPFPSRHPATSPSPTPAEHPFPRSSTGDLHCYQGGTVKVIALDKTSVRRNILLPL